MNSESWRNSLDALVEFMCAPTDGAAAELARLREERDRLADELSNQECDTIFWKERAQKFEAELALRAKEAGL